MGQLNSASGADEDGGTWSVCTDTTGSNTTDSSYTTWSVIRPDGKVVPVADRNSAIDYVKHELGYMPSFTEDTVPVKPIPNVENPKWLDGE